MDFREAFRRGRLIIFATVWFLYIVIVVSVTRRRKQLVTTTFPLDFNFPNHINPRN